ncbi:F-box/LRR-repeat protein 3-like [Prosopis cineraria]|uniref:F-box/LRR-repeat protein 3-like n=1 Tax=Prosopis cineraria TaxID=364024 RepID=UPI00240F2638|nr:F-box/LRR-repeat protein 3-like [Prosopis cineraria]
MKRHEALETHNPFDSLSEELVFTILDHLSSNSLDKKSFSLVCKSFHAIEAKHRRAIRPLRSELLPSILNRYPFVSHADLSLCPRVSDSSLNFIANAYSATLRRIDLSRSRFFSANGLLSLATNCKNLVELDLSNATELKDAAASAVAQAMNLEKLWLARCKLITDMGIGCIAVGCRKLKLICLKWCLGVGDLGVDLIAVKCQELRSLDLSYLPITGKCLSSIVKLQYLEDLVLEGCFGVDDDSLDVFKQGCTTLKKLDVSGCQNISHIGLSALTSCSGCIEQLTLSDGSSVTLALADALNKLPMLQSIILDGCLVTPAGLKAIGSSCMSLKELSLRKCLGVTDEALSFLVSKHKDLRKLDITCCRKITHLSIASIVNSCKNLTSLRMESCTLVPRKAFVVIGQQCDSLEELDLTDNEIDDEGLRSISRCSRLSSLKLGICLNITDKGLAYVGKSCSKLKELDLYRSTGITDLGISAIACGCPRLETINVAYCTDITDGSLISLSKCLELKTLEIRGCLLVTSKGLTAIAPNCKQLSRLDIKKCYKIDDSGMIPLACWSQNLKQINLSYSSVTDVGLLSLASISCLHTFSLLTLQGVTPRGLAAALLAFGGLRKVKLHVSLRSTLPDPLIKHVEARGCLFEWRNKVFQAEMDPKCWKLQLEDLMEVV